MSDKTLTKRNDIKQVAESIWVFGGGMFGHQAVEALQKKSPESKIVVIEKQPDRYKGTNIEIICTDGIEWLVDQLKHDSAVGKIIPALPVHLAAEWLKKRLTIDGANVLPTNLPDHLLHQFPHPIRQSHSQAVVSHADFLCPSHCIEPSGICSYTQQQRPTPLYTLLAQKNCQPFTPLIIRSRQFAPGVGGFYPGDLWNLLMKTRLLRDRPLLVGTACKCHGIIDGLTIA